MATFHHEDLKGSEFTQVTLRGSRFVESDLSGVVIRGSEVSGLEIDAPWLIYGEPLTINGVDVVAYVEAELDRRFPGRAQRQATDPGGLRAAWASCEGAWDAAIARAATLPAGVVDESVDHEWSFAQTLRHLVHATDLWFVGAVLREDEPLHPLGLGDTSAVEEGLVGASADVPPYDDVLAARADRVALVRDFLATVTTETLGEARHNPHDPEQPETVRSCVHTVLEESWEHLRFALRDLDAIEANRPS